MRELSEQEKAALYFQELDSTIAEIYLNREYIHKVEKDRCRELMERLIQLQDKLQWRIVGPDQSEYCLWLVDRNDKNLRLSDGDLNELRGFISKWYSKKAEPEKSFEDEQKANKEIEDKIEALRIKELTVFELEDELEIMVKSGEYKSKNKAWSALENRLKKYSLYLGASYGSHSSTLTQAKKGRND